VTGTYDATERIMASLMLSLSEEAYDDKDRDDTTYTVSPSVKYTLNNRVFGNLAYIYSDRDATGSDSANSDFTRNTVVLTVSASF